MLTNLFSTVSWRKSQNEKKSCFGFDPGSHFYALKKAQHNLLPRINKKWEHRTTTGASFEGREDLS